MGTMGTAGSPGARANDDEPVVLILTRQHAEALAALLARSRSHNPWLDAVSTQLPPRASDPKVFSGPSIAAASVFAAAEAVVAGARTDMAAEREAEHVAEAVATTEKVAMKAALMTAKAASLERDRKADAADFA
ncbi:MAG: hypothetical protein QOD35_2913, partial [Nocardioidaceae bacterium]|nr:hypothetical protein [Nocardioidaceae bacterium]